MRNILLVSATKLEHHDDDLFGIPIHIIGIGKVNAAVNTQILIEKYNPDIVINFGSVGSLKNFKVGEVLEVGTVYNDFYAGSIYNYEPIKISDSNIKCLSTDTFYEHDQEYHHSYLNAINNCDIVEMELYSIAKSCIAANKILYSYKWISDDGSSADWKTNASIGYNNFKKVFYERFSKEVA